MDGYEALIDAADEYAQAIYAGNGPTRQAHEARERFKEAVERATEQQRGAVSDLERERAARRVVDEALRDALAAKQGAVAALRRYGCHDMRCTKVTDDYAEMQPPRCSCGYDAALHRLGGR